jgi:hypothetical protein
LRMKMFKFSLTFLCVLAIRLLNICFILGFEIEQ